MFSDKDFYEPKFLHLLIPREILMSWINVWTCFSWLTRQQLSYSYWSLGHISLTFFLSLFLQVVVWQEYPLANTQTILEQAALSFCGLSSPSENAPRGPQSILPLRSYMRDHPQWLSHWRPPKAQGRPPTTSWPGDVLTPPGPGKVFFPVTWETLERTPIPLGNWVHPYLPGGKVWGKDWKKEPVQPVWIGPHVVVLANPTAVKVTSVIPWIHHIRVKKAATSCDEDTWKAVQDPENLHKLQFQKQQRSPMKDTEPRFSYSESWLVNTRQKPENSSALLQPHSSSWLINTQQKPEKSAIKISMDFHCQPWPLPLISIIAVLFITSPTRLPGWGGFKE